MSRQYIPEQVAQHQYKNQRDSLLAQQRTTPPWGFPFQVREVVR
jgi:hypothetical protein